MDVKISKGKILQLLDDLNTLLRMEQDYVLVHKNEKTENLLEPIENGLKEFDSILDTLYRIIE